MEPLKDSRWLAEICGVELRTVYKWQANGSGPVFTRLDSQRARYRVEDVERWLWERRSKIAA
jgi:phage terminase Nu1 subunit (DNA packaging protein)